MAKLRTIIVDSFEEALEQTGSELSVLALDDTTVLLESGLDSLGFAILVALLDEKLGYDPFSIMEEAVYPRTMGEFVSIYDKYYEGE